MSPKIKTELHYLAEVGWASEGSAPGNEWQTFVHSVLCVQGESQKDQNGGRALGQSPAANEPLMLSKHNLGYLQLKLLLCGTELFGVVQPAAPCRPMGSSWG